MPCSAWGDAEVVGQEGIGVHLAVAGGRIVDVTVTSHRMVTASGVLRGRSPVEAAGLLPLLFSLCGRAQQVAGLEALERAAGVAPSPVAGPVRRVVLAAEIVQETITALRRDWAQAAGGPADDGLLRAVRGALQPLGRDLSDAALGRAVAAVEGLDLPPVDPDAFRVWIAGASTPEAALLRQVTAEGLADFGESRVAALPGLPVHELEGLLAADTSGLFRAAPLLHDEPAETGPFATHADHPLVRSLGHGMMARLVARLVALHDAVRVLRDTVPVLWQHDPEARAAALMPPPAADGSGCGVVTAVRGLLVHWVDLRDGVVRDWRILAPTEWNFHPEGPLVAGLIGAEAGDDPARRARLLALALDPCVSCEVTVSEATTHA